MSGHAPLTRPPSPEQLDRALRVVPGLAWIALWLLLALVLAGLAWSLRSTAAVKTQAQGVLLSAGGVGDVVAPAPGRLLRLLASPGEAVAEGQLVALLDQPELEADLSRRRTEAASLEEQEARVRRFLEGEAEARRRLAEARQQALRARIASLAALEATMGEMASIQQGLFGRGLTTRERFLAAQQQWQEVRSQRSEAENSLVQIAADTEAERIRAERELLDLGMRRAAVAREIAWTEGELARRGRVLAPAEGMLVEQVANPGELVAAGAPVLRFLAGRAGEAESLVALLYVPPGDGKRVQPGMRAQIIPSTARVQRDGFIEGEVESVSAIPATREGILRTLKNAVLVDQLMQSGPPVLATVRLARDPAAAGGYRWSTGSGPALALGSGTLAEGRIVVDDIPLIALVLPEAERVLGWIGL
ncbi:NHLP bacteriocin system secretion protein [Pseudoroseomonas cervicalis]|uniref:NHLP bacteriocin system secretion protein n=1 Tax=Teichococcus cervicalis TaxID=204525 RepID=UPI0022F1A601|nr:NHLP bacteriocin system secretion protein [Pseudoroseomonas cervicalis]WBV45422.1 NHLP bacteriocin system secretion protein [Pseudoroseomonas cervicalis]